MESDRDLRLKTSCVCRPYVRDHRSDGRAACRRYIDTVKIDETAAGYGVTPRIAMEDSEFDVPVPDRELQTTEYSPAFGRMDLLTVGRVSLAWHTNTARRAYPNNCVR